MYAIPYRTKVISVTGGRFHNDFHFNGQLMTKYNFLINQSIFHGQGHLELFQDY